MAEEKVSLDALQSMLKGERMAIEIYEAVLDTVDDAAVKTRLEQMRNDHQRHAAELTEQITRLGGEPEGETGVTGWAAKASIRMRGWFQSDPRGILRQVYDGEDQGIAAAANIVEQPIDSESRALIKRIIDEDRSHLGQLEAVIAEKSGDM